MSRTSQKSQIPTRTDACRVFFPLAALYGALAGSLSVLAMTGSSWPAGLVGTGHGREMFFGFALALVSGYLLGPLSRRSLLALAGLWLAARVAAVALPSSLPGQLLSPLFALILGALVIPRFRHARKWRNKAVMPLLGAIIIMPLLWLSAVRMPLAELGALLFASLMLFMGGRLIAPVAAGAFRERGLHLDARVQPRLEALMLLLLGAAVVTLSIPVTRAASGTLMLVAGLVATIRLLRWCLWQCRRPDLWAAGVGYGWVALGLAVFGATLLQGTGQRTALHLVTVGGLGTLASVVMARQHYQRQWKRPPPALLMLGMMLLMTTATLSRLAADIVSGVRVEALWLAAVAWSVSLVWLAAHLLLDVPNSRVMATAGPERTHPV
ncbi:NnrS family protein [Kineobactrum salinum]|uniref:NnrS family protein n=1 Tax=Kineobactrum salinum TaxID=2708301 RepID=A0A6C0U3V2_9GAMM|nr:NnrS family protein [Kineobactrum salinum]QIB66533.1 NnrS family protein [Kineobactrum salinum]